MFFSPKNGNKYSGLGATLNVAKPKKGSSVAVFGLGAVDLAGWGVAVLVGVPSTDAIFKTNPFNFLDERTLKGTFFGNYKPRTDLPSAVDMFMNKSNQGKLNPRMYRRVSQQADHILPQMRQWVNSPCRNGCLTQSQVS
ncbi:hypothetical protein ACE6H2_028156 [Prunus campanulata]